MMFSLVVNKLLVTCDEGQRSAPGAGHAQSHHS